MHISVLCPNLISPCFTGNLIRFILCFPFNQIKLESKTLGQIICYSHRFDGPNSRNGIDKPKHR